MTKALVRQIVGSIVRGQEGLQFVPEADDLIRGGGRGGKRDRGNQTRAKT